MKKTIFLLAVLAVATVLAGCTQSTQAPTATPQPTITATPTVQAAASYPHVSRESAIPPEAVKMTPETDVYPPVLHSDEWETPVPLPAPINTRGAEDSPFIMPDGNTFYVWFTPSPSIPVEKQLFDNVTGIYVYRKVGGQWSEPERVWLIEPGRLSLEGCAFVQGNEMWFCAAREGYTGMNMFTATYSNGRWANWSIVDERLRDYKVGELHLSADGNTIYFHSDRAGGKGGLDIWTTEKAGGEWQTPVNFEIMNSPDSEGWPFISQDGNEFWFTRVYQGSPALFRSKKIDGEWTEPELIVSQFAGEPTLDNEGNLYFTHHFYENSTMIEADIYIARKK